MNDKDAKKSGRPLDITIIQEDVVVAQNKNLELFVKNFSYQSENITAKHLGQIFGFFEIPEITDDNAYIVNFLASVVKKEYFQNPRRSANESFEAALHKVNLALTELVKQGNTSWLGKLEGAVAVIEGDTLHFSVTGDATIFLYRNEESILISEGLADESSATHPLKTFLEISSGQLIPGDTLLLSSPELFSLCSEEILQKNVSRMDFDSFTRYIRAAMVNELELGTSIAITVTETTPNKTLSKKASHLREESLSRLQNVFSGSSFGNDASSDQETSTSASNLEKLEGEEEITEYIDKKTGHIYIQGDGEESDYQEPSWLKQTLSDTTLSIGNTVSKVAKRWSKKSKKAASLHGQKLKETTSELSQEVWESTKDSSAVVLAKSSRWIASQKKALLKRISGVKQTKINKLPPAKAVEPQEEEIFSPLATPVTMAAVPKATPEKIVPAKPARTTTRSVAGEVSSPDISFSLPTAGATVDLTPREERLATFTKAEPRSQAVPHSPSFFSYLEKALETTSSFLHVTFATLSWPTKNKKRLVITGALCLVGGCLLFFITKDSAPTQETAINTNPSIVESPSTEESLPSENTPSSQEIGQYQDSIVTLFADGENLYRVEKSTVLINDERFTLPENQEVKTAAYMKDLQLIFLWTNNNTLLSFSTVDKKFITNNVPLESGVTVSALGAYLTYLYVLDDNTGTIYRFPRTDGGFAPGTSWLKTPLGKLQGESEAHTFAVADTIRIASNKIEQYSKGTLEKTLSEEVLLLATSSESNFTLGLNPVTGNIVVWNSDGTEVLEKTLPEMKGVTTFTYNESQKKLFFAKDGKIYSLELAW